MNDTVIQAILAINSSAVVTVRGNDIDRIEWLEGTTEIPKADIQAKIDEVAYINKRKAAYPSSADFMEAYTEKEIGENNGKWDAYVINYNKVRSDNPKN